MNQEIKIKVTHKERVDKYIADNSDLSRMDAKKLIELKAVSVDGIEVRKTNFHVNEGNEILISQVIPKEIKAIPQDIPIEIIYEDNDLMVINKHSGMVVHPAPGHHEGTLVNALLHKLQGLSDIGGPIRPGIVHRIDKDTSGLLVVAKNNETHVKLSELLKTHDIKREYLAWVSGRLENEVTHIDLPIGRDNTHRQKMAVTRKNSKEAVTHVYVQKILDKKTLVRCELETGRTHQIRVHLAYIKHPILGDPIYGTKLDDFGQRLHAYKLTFKHPTTGKQMEFKVDPPKEFDMDDSV